MNLIEKLDQQNMKAELPEMNVGDTVRVHVKIKEGSRERIQVFEGTIIAKKHGGWSTLKQKMKNFWTEMQPFTAATTLYRCPQRSVERDRGRTAP